MHVVLTTSLLLIASNLFMTFAVFYMKEQIKLDCLWAAPCVAGAVFFIFRGR